MRRHRKRTPGSKPVTAPLTDEERDRLSALTMQKAFGPALSPQQERDRAALRRRYIATKKDGQS